MYDRDVERSCELVFKRPSGRVTREVQTFIVDKHGGVTLSKSVKANITGTKAVTDEQHHTKRPDPAAEALTFSLTRTQAEDEAKRQVVLPYMRAQQTGNGTNSGYEESDEADIDDEALDEEELYADDPDGDLDI
eukprot:TRINITY_DN10406_c0_g1_i2.p2 TRINITY_DN10406_c0_g1~~TRINITY_DN10406_c0_g1_i2.p2  ORF type:complete len:134 (-),score=35.89 TRINITY_DN10406_c0_g1_i2:20-421(-)